jgi:hypothetical protein
VIAAAAGAQLHQLEDEEEALLFHHRMDVVMAMAKYLLLLAPFAAFFYVLFKQSVPVPLGPLHSALVRLRIANLGLGYLSSTHTLLLTAGLAGCLTCI